MAESTYEKYVVRKPKVINMAHYKPEEIVRGRTFPQEIFMDNELVPQCPIFFEIGWIYEMPDPNPHISKHSHSHDELIVHIGTDPNNPQDLGAEIEFEYEDEKIIINTTSAIYVPKGLAHCPLTWKRVDRPHLEIVVVLGGEYD